MSFVRLEDTTGAIELVVFPKVLMEVRRFVREDLCVVVMGKTSVRDGGKKILCESVWSLTPENCAATARALGPERPVPAVVQ